MAAPNPVLARAWRGSVLESVHRGTIAVVRGRETVLAIGDVDAPQCLRSTAKPFQALAALEIALGAGFEMSDAEIAVVSSSHGGQPLHVGLVSGLLARAGIPEARLQCGAHPPMHGASAAALVRAGTEPTALHNNCSGKHAAMLIAAKILGAPLETYLDPDHPVQQRNLATLARFAEVPPETIGIAVDGCSAPTFVTSARSLARAYSNLVGAPAAGAASEAWRRWMAAIPREPVAYSGEGRTCTKLLVATCGRVVPKIGAEGVYALGIPAASVGAVTKIDDGSHRATEALVASLLLRIDEGLGREARATLERMREPPLKNHRGLVVGRLEVTLP
jgi:L-asparaginase II